MSDEQQTVSVVIPVYNGLATLDETLRSVRSQTYRDLEIIVVDDGSTDASVALAEGHAREDSRIRILRQANAGVAAARNLGWQSAKSDLIAFVDADDLWAPTKIERQVQTLRAAGDDVALVYCWFARIDGEGRIFEDDHSPGWEGDVLDAIFMGNFIGNGSSALVKRKALTDARGFEPALRDANAQGCEDYLFYCRVAERHRFAVVRERLLGYRELPDNMSSDLGKMFRSWLLVLDEMEGRYPERRARLLEGLWFYAEWLVARAHWVGNPGVCKPLLQLLRRRYPRMALRLWLYNLRLAVTTPLKRRIKRTRGQPTIRYSGTFKIGSIG